MLTREQELELQRNTEIKENDSLRQQLAQARQATAVMGRGAVEGVGMSRNGWYGSGTD